jgi:hypothetical protein
VSSNTAGSDGESYFDRIDFVAPAAQRACISMARPRVLVLRQSLHFASSTGRKPARFAHCGIENRRNGSCRLGSRVYEDPYELRTRSAQPPIRSAPAPASGEVSLIESLVANLLDNALEYDMRLSSTR